MGICSTQRRIMNPASSGSCIRSSCMLSQGIGLRRTSTWRIFSEFARICILRYVWFFLRYIWPCIHKNSMVKFHSQGHHWLIQLCRFHKQPCTSIIPFRETFVNPPLTVLGSGRSGGFWRACGSCLLCSCSNGSLRGSWSRPGLGMISA